MIKKKIKKNLGIFSFSLQRGTGAKENYRHGDKKSRQGGGGGAGIHSCNTNHTTHAFKLHTEYPKR